jgi:uncharacterized membrane protein
MSKRLFAIDAVRGWVMILMALDHAMVFCYFHIWAEGFQGIRPEPLPDAAHYLTRFVTHWCAPTFIFLAGLSVALFTLSRRSQGLTERQITRKLVTRGLLLIGLQLTVVNLTWGFGVSEGWNLVYFGVLSCIGSGLIVLAFARRLPVSILTGGSVLLLLVMPFVLRALPLPPGGDHPLREVLLQPDKYGWLAVNYPVLPWLGVMGLGCGLGLVVGARPERTARLFLLIGALALGLWLPVRLVGGYGNLTPYQGGDWRDLFLMSKYPPSLVFLMWTLGGMALAVAVLHRLAHRLRHPRFWSWRLVTLFGQTPLFFYVVHLVLYRVLGFVPFLRGSLAAGYLAWLVGLAVMAPLCYGYRALKRRHPQSVLQYL